MDEKNPEQEQKVIPSVSFNDNVIVVDTFEVPINFNGEEVKIKMKKLTAGDQRDIVKTNAPTKLVGTQTTGNLDAIGYRISLLSKVIVEAPFPIDNATISSLPDEVLVYLFEEYAAATNSKKKR